MACPPNSREKKLVAALVQLANARLKQKMGRNSAAEKLMAIAERHWQEAFLGWNKPICGLQRASFSTI